MATVPTSKTIFVHGVPATQGSKSLIRVRGRTMMIEQSRRLAPWRSAVASQAVASGVTIHEDDVCIEIVAMWTRPSSHFTTSGDVRKSAPVRPGYADCDKIARAICDALAGIAYRNDRQVARLSVERAWCGTDEPCGARITISPI